MLVLSPFRLLPINLEYIKIFTFSLRCKIIIKSPSTSRNTASTKTIIIIFSLGFINTSKFQYDASLLLLATTKRTDLGIMGV